jgi:hypothetical protein
MRMKVHICAWLVMALVVFCVNVPNGATQELPTLDCLRIQAGLAGPTHPQLSYDSLRRTVFVELRAKLPRLLLKDDCANRLEAHVGLHDISETNLDAWYGLVVFRVTRPVTVTRTEQVLNAEVWSPGTLLFHGSKDTVSDQVTQNLTKFIERLAEEFYLSGNY